jgi:transposase
MEAHPATNSSCPGCIERDRRIAELEARVAALEAMVEQLRRGGKRQAAPFSKGPPKPDPKKPGRKSGEDYGTKARRRLPPRIDEVHEAQLPCACPGCGGGRVEHDHTAQQYQAEIPRTVIYRQFNVQVGHCRSCGRRVQGRHALQTSDALGACASQLGPDAQALAVHLNKSAGLSHGKIKVFFHTLFGIDLSRSGVCQAVLRAGRKAKGSYDAIVTRVRQSRHVVPDETGWRVGGLGAWLHAFVTPDAAAYAVDRHRGFDAAAAVLGADYAGQMTHDGWPPYLKFEDALHQLCLGHLLRRCHELLEVATRGAVNFPRQVRAILKEALAVRDDRDAGRLPARRAAATADRLDARMHAMLRLTKTHPPNERLAKHLWTNRDHLFTFLRHRHVDATNWRAEQAIRPAVVNRKVWGGNRTDAGARAQSVLMSVLQTAKLRGLDSMQFLSALLCAPADQRPLLLTA